MSHIGGYPVVQKLPKVRFSHYAWTVWYGHYFLILPPFKRMDDIQLDPQRTFEDLTDEEQALVNLTFNTIKTILNNPKKFPLTQELFNILFIYGSMMYNLWIYYGDSDNYGYAVWELLAQHKLVTKEVIDNIINVHANAVFTGWHEYVSIKENTGDKKIIKEGLDEFVKIVFGYLEQWSEYLTAKFPSEEQDVHGYYRGLYLNNRLNDHADIAITSDGMFSNYVSINDPDFNVAQVKRLLPKRSAMEARWREVRFQVAWNEMVEELENFMNSAKKEKKKVKKIRKLDIYQSLKSFNIGFYEKDIEPQYDQMTPEDIKDVLIHRQVFNLQKIFIEGITEFNEYYGRRSSLHYYYPEDLFNDDARKVLEEELLVKPLPNDEKKLKYVHIKLMEYINHLQPNYYEALFKQDEDILRMIEEALMNINNDRALVKDSEDDEEEDEYEYTYEDDND